MVRAVRGAVLACATLLCCAATCPKGVGFSLGKDPATSQPTEADPVAGKVGPPPVDPESGRLPRLDVALRVLQIRVPSDARSKCEPLWTYVREDVLDAEVHRRLRENGIRVGVSRLEWYEQIRGVLSAVPDHSINEPEPLRLPFGFPLGLELDKAPRDQTLFFLNEDNVLVGETWEKSRNQLRISYVLDASRKGRIRLEVMPQVRREKSEIGLGSPETGFSPPSRLEGRTFEQAGFYLGLDADEILVLAPNENATAYGIIGGAFLTEDIDRRGYDRYVLIRPEVSYVENSGDDSQPG